MKTILFLFLLCVFSIQSSAQLFNKIYGTQFDDIGTAITRTSDGGLAIAGLSYAPNHRMFILKLKHNGVIQWTKNIFENHLQAPVSIFQMANGNYFIGGNVYNQNVTIFSPCAIMLDSAGNVIWAQIYGDPALNCARSFSQTSDGGFIGCGLTYNGNHKGWLFKIDANGNLQWSKKYSCFILSSVKQTSDGGFLAVSEKSGIQLLKTDSLGNVLWEKEYLGNSGCQTYDLELNGNGALISGGTVHSPVGGWDVFLLNVDSIGNRIWFKTYGSPFSEWGYSVSKTLNNNIIITGKTNDLGHGNDDMFLIYTDLNGQLIWAKTIGESLKDESKQVLVMPDSGFVCVGSSFHYSSIYDSSNVYVVRTDKFGNTCNAMDWNPVEQTQFYNPNSFPITQTDFGMDSLFKVINTSVSLFEQDICFAEEIVQSDISRDQERIQIFPNPVSVSATIRFSNSLRSAYSVRIIDMEGRVISGFENSSGEFNLNCEFFPKGCYLMEIFNSEKIYRQIFTVF